MRMLDEGFNKSAWHGPNMRGAIRRVDAEQAGWRPYSERKSIADHMVHAAYWKYAARRRLTGGVIDVDVALQMRRYEVAG